MFNGNDPGDFDYVEDFDTGEKRSLRDAFKDEPKAGASELGSMGVPLGPAGMPAEPPSAPSAGNGGSWTSPETGRQIGQILGTVFEGLTARQKAEALQQMQAKPAQVKLPQRWGTLIPAAPRTKYGIGVYVLAAIGTAAAIWGIYYLIKRSRAKTRKGEKR